MIHKTSTKMHVSKSCLERNINMNGLKWPVYAYDETFNNINNRKSLKATVCALHSALWHNNFVLQMEYLDSRSLTTS
jgi:hypothetical protein